MNYRHGDLALTKISKLPNNLKETKTKVIMNGSGGHDHSFEEGKIYFKKANDFVFGYLEATKNTKLFHLEHGKIIKGKKLREANITEGVYELRRQCEDTHEGMKQVID